MKKFFCKAVFLVISAVFGAGGCAFAMPLDAHVMTVVSKYFAASEDYVNPAKSCKEYAVVPKILRINPSPIESRQEAEKFQKVFFMNLVTLRVSLTFI